MKKHVAFIGIVLLSLGVSERLKAQDDQISTLFSGNGLRSSGGYGTLVNKFTTIDGKLANFAGFYGGWYVNHKFLIGVGGGSTTNFIRVPEEYSALPEARMTYGYGQCGLVTEYVIASNRAVHAAFHLFTGAGFTLQYERNSWPERDYNRSGRVVYDDNWFVVVEPGVQVELNLLKWMRFCPGVSYRTAYGSNGAGLTDGDIRGLCLNLGMKFGKF